MLARIYMVKHAHDAHTDVRIHIREAAAVRIYLVCMFRRDAVEGMLCASSATFLII